MKDKKGGGGGQIARHTKHRKNYLQKAQFIRVNFTFFFGGIFY